jgi:hypothetical protein
MHIYPSLGLTSYPVGTEPELPFSWKIRMNEMKELLAFLLAANFMKMTSTAPVYSDEDEGNRMKQAKVAQITTKKKIACPASSSHWASARPLLRRDCSGPGWLESSGISADPIARDLQYASLKSQGFFFSRKNRNC